MPIFIGMSFKKENSTIQQSSIYAQGYRMKKVAKVAENTEICFPNQEFFHTYSCRFLCLH